MSAAAALGTGAADGARSGLQLLLQAAGTLTPSRFVAAISLGVANHVFVALTYAGPGPRGISELIVLLAAMAATVAADRTQHRRSAWGLLAMTYALLVSAALHEPSYAHYVLIDQVMSHALALAVAVADRQVATGPAGRLTYVVAGVAGIVAGGLVLAAILHAGPDLFADGDSWPEARTLPWFRGVFALYTVFHWLLFGGAAVLFYGERRLAEAAVERLRGAELDRITQSRRIVESTLQLMQARIEPQFLFNTLMQVKQLYGREPTLAESMLDELGAFLRAAMPHMRDSSSTAGQEIELARAYLGILRIRLRDRLHYVIEMPAELATGRLPSMMLLPLIDHAVKQALASPVEDVRLRITASLAGARFRLMIGSTARGSGESTEAAVAGIRERLDILYRGDACLTLGRSPSGGMQALLDVPFERA
jgi:hypothetical protein